MDRYRSVFTIQNGTSRSGMSCSIWVLFRASFSDARRTLFVVAPLHRMTKIVRRDLIFAGICAKAVAFLYVKIVGRDFANMMRHCLEKMEGPFQ